MLPSLSVLLFTLLAGLLVLLLVGLIREVRGVEDDPTQPERAWDRTVRQLKSPTLAATLGLAALAGVVTLVLTRWPVLAVSMAVFVLVSPRLFGGQRVEQVQIRRLEALVVFTESLRDTMSAHASLEHAIPAAAANAPAVLRPALVRMIGQLRSRVPMDQALFGLAADLDDRSADRVLGPLILSARRRGDRLIEVLTGLAVSAREELELRQRITMGRKSIRSGVRTIVIVTVGMVLFLALFARGFVEPYSTPMGQVALAVVVAIFATGFAWIRRLAEGRPQKPILARPDRQLDPRETELVLALTSKLVGAGGDQR